MPAHTVTRRPSPAVRTTLSGLLLAVALAGAGLVGSPVGAQQPPTPLPARIDPGEVFALANGAEIENHGNLYLVVDVEEELQGGLLIHIVGALFDVEGAACRKVPSGMGCVVPPLARVLLVEGPLRPVDPSIEVRAGGQAVLANNGAIVNEGRLRLTVADYGEVEGGRQVTVIAAGVRTETAGDARCRPLSDAKWDCLIPADGTVVFRPR